MEFFSIGTNDLIKKNLAIDRADDTVSHLYNPLHPSVLRLILMTIKAGEKFGKSVSVCGEMAGDAKLTKLLIGMGMRQLSMHPSHILSVKQQVLHSELEQVRTMTKKILHEDEAEKIERLLVKLNQQ